MSVFRLWGPRYYSGEVIIIIGGDEEDYREMFRVVEEVEVIKHKYVMPFENNLPVFLCRDIIRPLKEVWVGVKHFE